MYQFVNLNLTLGAKGKDFKMTQTMQSCLMLMVRKHTRDISAPVQKESTADILHLQLVNSGNINLKFSDKDENKVEKQMIRVPKVDLDLKVYTCTC